MSDHRYRGSARRPSRAGTTAFRSCVAMLFSVSIVLVDPTIASDRYYDLLDQLDAHESAYTSSIDRNSDYGPFCVERADILVAMVEEAPNEVIRRNVVIELADILNQAILNGAPSEGRKHLLASSRRLASIEYNEGVAYLRYVKINRDFTSGVEESGNCEEPYNRYLAELRKFARTFPKCPRAASALFSLACDDDVRGRFESAREKYHSIVANYPDTPEHKSAKGALNRLTSVGKDLVVTGADARGRKVDLADYEGTIVLLVFALPEWRNWQPRDFKRLWKLYHSNSRADFEILFILTQCGTRIHEVVRSPHIQFPWPTILDVDNHNGSLATRYGIAAHPTFIVVDRKGRMVRELRHLDDIESNVRSLIEQQGRSQGIADPSQNDGKSNECRDGENAEPESSR